MILHTHKLLVYVCVFEHRGYLRPGSTRALCFVRYTISIPSAASNSPRTNLKICSTLENHLSSCKFYFLVKYLQEARAHMNYGAILHLNGKYTEATKSYLTALRLKPEDDVTLMNLKKVMEISESSKSLVLISCQQNINHKDLLSSES